MNFKRSKTLNKIFNEILNWTFFVHEYNMIHEINPDFYAIFSKKSEGFITAEELNGIVSSGINLAKKSLRIKKPIYALSSDCGNYILYFVNDFDNLKKYLESKLKQSKAIAEKSERDYNRKRARELAKALKKVKK